MLRWLPLKLTVPLFVLLFAFPGFAASDAQKPELIDALELGLKSPGKVIDLAPYRDKAPSLPTNGRVDAKTRLKVDNSFGRMPLLFEKNEGQTSDEVKFLSRGRGYNFYLTPTESVMVLSKAVEEKEKGVYRKRDPLDRLASLENPPKMERAVVHMQVVGANEKAIIKGEERLASTSNYFIGNDQSKWRQGVPNYKKVHYEEVYPGIDLVYYGNQSKLEYDFIVKPGANPNNIELNFKGADKLSLDDKGTLVLETKVGKVVQHAPIIYQTIDGEKQSVNGEYIIKGNNRVAFHITSYNAEHDLVIDPVLGFSTYLGGDSSDDGFDIIVDPAGNIFLTGITNSTDFPTLNAFQSSLGGASNDVFVTKFSPSGALIFSTYLGGADADSADNFFDDGPRGLGVDDSGNIYLTGETASSDFPLLNAFQNSFGGVSDIFITKFNASGSLIFSTYIGGADRESIRGFNVDGTGIIYTAGTTLSTDFPTHKAFQGSHGGDIWDVFMAKFDSTGSLVFSTFFGGTGQDVGYGLKIDPLGSSFLMGITNSTNFPILNAFQSSLGGSYDAYVAKFDPTGSLVFSTHLGGSGMEFTENVDVDSSGNVYLAGRTLSANFPLINAIQNSLEGDWEGVVTKFNPLGQLVYSTYLGGIRDDFVNKISVEGLDNILITGYTQSSNFPTFNAFQGDYAGGKDAYLAKIKESPIPHTNDFNIDTFSDVLAVHSSGILVSALIEHSVLQDFALLLQADPAQGWTVNATGDFNGDKKADLLLYNTTTGEYRTVLLDGTTVLSDTVVFTIDPVIGVEPRGVGDFDGDGEVEIIIYHPPSGFTGLVYLVGGAFSTFEEVTTIDVAGNWTLQDTGHFNGDNKTDFLITNSVSGESAVIEMDGSVPTGPSSIFTLDPALGLSVIDTGDFNGDGKSDVLTLHTSGALGVVVMDGLVFQSFYVPGGLSSGWELVNVGNYDGVNKADFLIYDTNTGDLLTAVQDGTVVTAYTLVLNLGVGSGWSYHGGKP